ncbi:MAG: SprT-like domain-containing protein [Bacteroidetes bacterium]|jgi:predicted SprT family Zn-dependent metalloprotease|nr:SprT-like domain-containing protein [Bacteroidota bacterium]MBX7130773.1 SprT-like domain-containing protein [Flavobacteriales bacterium]MCC6654373.1 SprT-like domain-containing protein [Flavobacteriales bacterium]HMU15287.1 SprT-like domain-containing protein [Flavobacteriales bacterium]HNE80102.1 SprT-like domain-containing protein [Flavobacteriales bacterium]
MATHRSTDLLGLRAHVPAAAWPVIMHWLQRNPVIVHLSPSRKTKLGDYRVGNTRVPHRITVNNDLNRYAFLTVLVHEFAHYSTFQKFRRHQPHGPEWKAEYRRLMRPFLSSAVFPADVLHALEHHLADAPSSSCTDHGLMRTLRRYDPDPRPFLEELPASTVFRFQQKIFVKGERLRKRYRCKCLNDRRIYHIDPTVEVQLEQTTPVRRAS